VVIDGLGRGSLIPTEFLCPPLARRRIQRKIKRVIHAMERTDRNSRDGIQTNGNGILLQRRPLPSAEREAIVPPRT